MDNLKKENNSCLGSPPLQTSVYMKHLTTNDGVGFQTKESTREKQVLPSPRLFPWLKGMQ